MNSYLENYIEENKVSEANFLLFREYEDFLRILFSCGKRVEMIIWYEYCKINEQKIGTGGYKDTQNNEYMWAETTLYETDLQKKSLNEVLSYITEMKNKYITYNLCPEFYIC